MPDQSFHGFAYRQSEHPAAPIIFCFVAAVDQIEHWCGVPRRIDDVGTGFQRTFEETRVRRIRRFFSNQENCSPTALAVGFRRDEGIKLLEVGGADPLPLDAVGTEPTPAILHLTGALVDDLPATVIDGEGHAQPSDATSIEALRSRLTELLHPVAASAVAVPAEAANAEEAGFESQADDDSRDLRIQGPSIAPEDASIPDRDGRTTDEIAVIAIADGDESLAEEGDDSEDDDTDVDLGQSRVAEVLRYLADEQWVRSNWVDLLELLKPGAIIDGQHRLLGAARERGEIPFAVCALVNLSLAEQVIQFIIVNSTAKRLPKKFVTGTAVAILDEAGLERATRRTTQAGLHVRDVDVLRYLNSSDESPFKGRIDISSITDQERLGFGTMLQIGKAWYEPGSESAIDNVRARVLQQGVAESERQFVIRRNREWREHVWHGLLAAFWNQVRSAFPDTWGRAGSHLNTTAVLRALQDAFLDHLASQAAVRSPRRWPAAEPERRTYAIDQVGEIAEDWLAQIPEEVFSLEWAETQLNTSTRIAQLKRFFAEFDQAGAAREGAWKERWPITPA